MFFYQNIIRHLPITPSKFLQVEWMNIEIGTTEFEGVVRQSLENVSKNLTKPEQIQPNQY